MAAALSAGWVSIKVDREERPDLDAVYMNATQAMTGQGGWPMTVLITPDGEPFPGLYAAGEVAGFGGGGVHGYNALEGTFLGGCIFSGMKAGRAMAREV